MNKFWTKLLCSFSFYVWYENTLWWISGACCFQLFLFLIVVEHVLSIFSPNWLLCLNIFLFLMWISRLLVCYELWSHIVHATSSTYLNKVKIVKMLKFFLCCLLRRRHWIASSPQYISSRPKNIQFRWRPCTGDASTFSWYFKWNHYMYFSVHVCRYQLF